jgi:alpha-L-fucosidase 2
MNKMRWWPLFLLMSFNALGQLAPFDKPLHGFESWMPAPTWEDGLLSGNGAIGTVVFGNPYNETIIVNHAQFFLPTNVPPQTINQASRLTEIRQLLTEGKFQEAANIPVEQSMIEGYGKQMWIDPLVPFCNIKLQMEAGNVTNYRRMVDFETGESKVECYLNGQLVQRRLFVSRTDNVVVMSIKSSAKINCQLGLARHHVAWDQWGYVNGAIKSVQTGADESFLTYRTEFRNQWDGSIQGFEGVAKVETIGGSMVKQGDWLSVSDADEVLVTMVVEPNYNYAESLVPLLKSRLQNITESYETFLESHKLVHGDLFGRVKLNLGGGDAHNLQSEAFVLKARQQVTPAAIERQFDAARYNIISSMGINPPTLQGIWSGTWTPPWSSGFTHDGNVEVAVSALLSTRTPELMKAYMGYHERMMAHYRDNARLLFGCKGIVMPAHSSSHGWTIHFDPTWCLSLWTGGAGWTSGVLYDYFLYTGDKEYLANHIYPFMRESAWFYEDFLTIGTDGKYLFSPSYSPENNPANGTSQACINATMDVMIAKELLRNCIEAGTIVGEEKAQLAKWRSMLALMPNYRINSQGALAEWLPETMDDNYHHRHVSHLYALYERIDPDFKSNPSLMEASKVAVDKRMFHRRNENGGEMVFGLAQMGMVTANLGDRQSTAEIIDWMSKYYWAPSMATYHNSGSLFNMDMSGGFPAVIMKALAYSEPGTIKLLPALPVGWEKGSIEGMALRGQITMDRLAWEGNSIEVVLTSAKSQSVALFLPADVASMETSNGKNVRLSKQNKQCINLTLEAGKKVSFNVKMVGL